MTVKELQAALSALHVGYSRSATKAELETLLEKAQSAAAAAEEAAPTEEADKDTPETETAAEPTTGARFAVGTQIVCHKRTSGYDAPGGKVTGTMAIGQTAVVQEVPETGSWIRILAGGREYWTLIQKWAIA